MPLNVRRLACVASWPAAASTLPASITPPATAVCDRRCTVTSSTVKAWLASLAVSTSWRVAASKPTSSSAWPPSTSPASMAVARAPSTEAQLTVTPPLPTVAL